MIGQVVAGKYEIARLVGEGGMGAVYEAVHTGTGRRVAVKVILTQDLAKNAELVARFQREARAAGAIDTQHIVQVMDVGTDPASGAPFMVMELLRGEDLQHLVSRLGPLPADLALRVVAQALLGLGKAHDARVVHRDIKSANLYLARRDAGEVIVKVLDFGIAKVKMDQLSSSDGGLTRTGSMLGSPLYMSPEQAKGLKTIDHRTDIWSVGVVLYEALCGRTPHHHVDTLGQLILSICSEAPPPLQDLAPWVAPEVASVAHRALRMDPADRYQTAADMLAAVRGLLPQGWAIGEAMLAPMSDAERAVVAPRLTITAGAVSQRAHAMARTEAAPVGAQTGTAMTQSQPLPARRSPAAPLFALGAVGLVALAGLGAWKVFGSRVQAPMQPVPPPAAASASALQPAPDPSVVATGAQPASRNVRLAVAPAGVSVEVDGASAEVRGGAVDVSGPLGSTHQIRLRAGGRESTAEVAITEAGALPARLVLGVAPPKIAKAAETAAGKQPPAPATAEPATKPTAKPAQPTGLKADTEFK